MALEPIAEPIAELEPTRSAPIADLEPIRSPARDDIHADGMTYTPTE
jgi:hypothetical protein